MLTMPSFKKSLIVQQFQGNYLKKFACEVKRKTNRKRAWKKSTESFYFDYSVQIIKLFRKKERKNTVLPKREIHFNSKETNHNSSST